MDSLQKIGKFEAMALIIMIAINQVFLNLSNNIISSTNSSAWINVIYISIIAIIFCLLICKLFKPLGSKDIIDVSEFLGGKILKTVISIIYLLFFIFTAGIFLSYLVNTFKIIYFPKTPIIFLLLIFLIPIVIAGKTGIKAIAQINLMLLPVFIIIMLILLFSTAGSFVPERLLPILGFGADKTFITGLSNIFAFSGFAYLYFLIPILKEPKEFKKIAVTSIIVSAIYLFLSVICLLMLFPYITFTDELLSVYLLARIIEFGTFFQRVDAIFVFTCILSTLSVLTFTTAIAANIFKKITSIKHSKQIIYSTSALIFSVAVIFKDISSLKFVEDIIWKYTVICLVFIISPILLIFANLKIKRRNKYENKMP